jgi:hypothetical protein
MDISKNKIPDKYYCEKCSPRTTNQIRAKILQKKYYDENLLKKTLKKIPSKKLQNLPVISHKFNINQKNTEFFTDPTDNNEHTSMHSDDMESFEQSNIKKPTGPALYSTSYDEVSENVYSKKIIKLFNSINIEQKQQVFILLYYYP